jgi:hypothetical protein
MDRADLDEQRAREVCADLDALAIELRERGLRVSSWYGGLEPPYGDPGWERANRGLRYSPLPGAANDDRFPWFLYWEIAWLVTHNRFRPGERLLDLGGCSSLFSCYMASKGLEVVSVDLNRELVANGDELAAATGWRLRNLRMDMRDLSQAELGGPFDHVTSVCVFEHIPLSGRLDVGGRIRDLLVDRGSFSITFDYLNPSPGARIGSPADVEEQFVTPSGLRVRGNRDFHDNGLRYLLHPSHDVPAEAEYTFGALFQER